MMFLQVDVLERECRNLSFEKIVKIVSPKCFEIEAQIHESTPYSFSGQMVGHSEKVKLSMNHENIEKLGRPSFSEIVARPLICWLLYSFLLGFFFNG